MTTLTAEHIRVGSVLFYKGDEVAFVEAKHLIAKGAKTGRWMLPAFQKNDAMPAGGAWSDVPGSKTDRYTIVKIETGRVNARSGKPLADLVWVVGDGYGKDVQFGLNPGDLIAKFGLLGADPTKILADDKIDARVKEHLAGQRAAEDQLKHLQDAGW